MDDERIENLAADIADEIKCQFERYYYNKNIDIDHITLDYIGHIRKAVIKINKSLGKQLKIT